MYFAIIGEDVPDSLALRLAARPAHLARLELLAADNRVLLAGPFPATGEEAGFTGSLIVAEFDSLESCRAWAEADPYVAAGVYRNVTVRPFKKVFP